MCTQFNFLNLITTASPSDVPLSECVYFLPATHCLVLSISCGLVRERRKSKTHHLSGTRAGNDSVFKRTRL